ncbi:hypothetical protein RFI_10567 [Reticulomyxa filosa]|uniref:Uncharacterized protein n=1 Tax=Reticulomyxa filosa TaxID=46433 RepID=X6NJT5_RETFI|nr:hypothetical protein RFI_10567 [Reticulomyxa filosa]|eukprot:ETO26570.1 hypothetical protein RFI_10567 [Reticulomyxa filosa]
MKAAQKTTPEKPLIILTPQAAHWTLCNQIANKISHLCAASFIHKDIVLPLDLTQQPTDSYQTKCADYLMALTCEPEENVKNRKVRIMLVQKSRIEELLEHHPIDSEKGWDDIFLEDEIHRYRWTLLHHIARAYQKQPKHPVSGRILWAKPLCSLELCTISQPIDKLATIPKEKLKDYGDWCHSP